MAFLGIKIPAETGRLLKDIEVPGEKTGIHEMHITILLLEDNLPISEIAKSLEAAYDIISKTKPFKAKIDKIACFPKHENHPYPIIAHVKSDELNELQKKLKRKFNKEDIDFNKKFKKYQPHITLSYADKEIEEFKIEQVEFMIQEIMLFGGDHSDSPVFITFPLKGPKKHKHSFLLQKIDMFHKMALNT